MGLLTDLYNTVAKFFRSQDGNGDEASKSVATSRLKLVLMQDRTNLTPKILEQMRGELVDLLSKYLEMDKDLLELNFEQEGDQVALMLSIPVIRAKDEDEIEEALAAQRQHEAETGEIEEDSNEDDNEEEYIESIENTDENQEENEEIDETEEISEENSKISSKKENKYIDPIDMKKEPAEKENSEEKVSGEV